MKRVLMFAIWLCVTVIAVNALERTPNPEFEFYENINYVSATITGQGKIFVNDEMVGDNSYYFSQFFQFENSRVGLDVYAMAPGCLPSYKVHAVFSNANPTAPKPAVFYYITEQELVFTAVCDGSPVSICVDGDVVEQGADSCIYTIPRGNYEQYFEVGAYASLDADVSPDSVVACSIFIPAIEGAGLAAPILYCNSGMYPDSPSVFYYQVFCEFNYERVTAFSNPHVYYYLAYSSTSYPSFSDSELFEVDNPGEIGTYSIPGYYRIAAFAVGDNNAVSDVSYLEFTIHQMPTAAPLVYAHHVDAEQGLAIRVVDGVVGENEVSASDYALANLYGPQMPPESFYYQIDGSDQWQRYTGEIYLGEYGHYTVSAYATSTLGSNSDIVTATIDYGPDGYTCLQGNYLFHNGLVYYVNEGGSVGVADYYFDHFNDPFMNYPIVQPVRSGEIVIPATVQIAGNDYEVTSIGVNALAGFTSVSIPSTVTYINANGGMEGHDGYPDLLSLTVDENNQYYDSRDNCNAVIETATNTLILGCQGTVIPDDVIEIANRAFFCSGLTDITIPSSVTFIGGGAFYGSTQRVVCHPVMPPIINDDTFMQNDGDCFENITVYVPQESLQYYIGDSQWGKFTHIVPFIGAGPGDINGDGNIAINDVTNLIDQLLGGEEIPAYCDVDGDGNVSIKDVTALIDQLLSGN